MKRALLYLTLLMMAAAISACGVVDPPVACYDNMDYSCDMLEQIRETGDMVCNMEVTLAEECAELTAMLPPMVPIPEICQHIPDAVGTCQLIGATGDPCAEDDDCEATCDLGAGVCL